MGIFDGRLDLLLMFIAQVVQIILFILVYIRISEMVNSGTPRTRFASRSRGKSDALLESLKFSHMLRTKKRSRA